MTMQKSKIRLVAEKMTCPVCGAGEGEACYNRVLNKEMKRILHSRRYEVAREFLKEASSAT